MERREVSIIATTSGKPKKGKGNPKAPLMAPMKQPWRWARWLAASEALDAAG
jgi:hypothetical protein